MHFFLPAVSISNTVRSPRKACSGRRGPAASTPPTWCGRKAGRAGGARLVEGACSRRRRRCPPRPGAPYGPPVFHKPMVENTAMNRPLIPIGRRPGRSPRISRPLLAALFSWRPLRWPNRRDPRHPEDRQPRHGPEPSRIVRRLIVRSSVFFFVAFLMGTFSGKAAPFPLSLPRRRRPPIPAHDDRRSRRKTFRGATLARVLGAARRGDGYLHGNGYVVTWAIGHLVGLPQPGDIEAECAPGGGTRCRCCRAAGRCRCCPKAATNTRWCSASCARTNREGGVRHTTPRRRADLPLHLRSGRLPQGGRAAVAFVADPGGDQPGFARLRPGREFDRLAAAARAPFAGRLAGRPQPLPRLHPGLGPRAGRYPVGRPGADTPPWRFWSNRELAIRTFVPEPYFEVIAEFDGAATRRRPSTAVLILRATTRKTAACRATASWRGRSPNGCAADRPGWPSGGRDPAAAAAPRYDLTELQRHANRLFGFTAQRHPGGGAAALRAEEAAFLPADRQPPLVDRRRQATCRRITGALRGRYGAFSRRAPASGRCRAASWTTPRSPTTTPSFPPRPTSPGSARRRRAKSSTTWSAAGCSRPGTASR